MVSACTAAQEDETKLKPFAVFCEAKKKSKSLDKEFESRCLVKSSSNA